MERQNSIPCGRDSMSVRIEAPVVVNPDIVSKNASVYDGMDFDITKGRAPAREENIHPKVTTRNPLSTLGGIPSRFRKPNYNQRYQKSQ